MVTGFGAQLDLLDIRTKQPRPFGRGQPPGVSRLALVRTKRIFMQHAPSRSLFGDRSGVLHHEALKVNFRQ